MLTCQGMPATVISLFKDTVCFTLNKGSGSFINHLPNTKH